MFKKIGCLLPMLAVLLFLTYISIKQGYNTVFHDDWTENYSKLIVPVVDVVEDSSYTSRSGTSSGYYQYFFNPVVEYELNGKDVIDTIIFMTSYEESDWYPGDSILINVNNFGGQLSKDIEKDKNATGIVNIIMGLVFLFLSYRIVRFLIKARQNKEDVKQQN